MQALVFDDEIDRLQRFRFGFSREADQNVTVHGDVQIEAVLHDPSDVLLFDAFLHEVHDSLVIGLQAEYDLQTAGLTHGLEQLPRSEEHTSELQSLRHLVCRLLLEKKKNTNNRKSS